MHLWTRQLLQISSTVRNSESNNLDNVDKFSNHSSSGNTTGGFFGMDNESDEGGFSDMETVAMACVATLIPLFLFLILGFVARTMWRKYYLVPASRSPGGSTNALRRDESSDTAGPTRIAEIPGQQLPDEVKTSESGFSVTPLDDPGRLDAPQVPLLGTSSNSNSIAPTSGPPTKSANGSIITLTMQNNHLIVETESPGDDGAGADAMSADSLDVAGASEQAALIHAPPRELPRSPSPPCLTGLSQSLSSLGSPSYAYGTQMGYPASAWGYPVNLGYSAHTPPSRPRGGGGGVAILPASMRSRHLLTTQMSMQVEGNFAPSHHRSASLPMRLARSQTVCEKLPPPTEEEDERGGGRKPRASLPLINPGAASVLSKLSSDLPPPATIAE